MITIDQNCQLFCGDCLEVMKQIPDGSVDMILCDLPYGATACKWDTIIPFAPLWEQYKRIIKNNGAIVLFGSQPFASALVMSNPGMFRHEWIWQKQQGTNPLCAKKQPMKCHESILVFSKKRCVYNPQMTKGEPYSGFFSDNKKIGEVYGGAKSIHRKNNGTRYPLSIIRYNTERTGLHPTQKPVALCEYLIKTYTNAGDVVLDNCMGSGTTGVACKNLNRKFIGIELDEEYFKTAENRIKGAKNE